MARNNKPIKPLTEAPPEPESSSEPDDPSSGSSTEPDHPNTAEPKVSSAASSTEDDEDDDGEEEEEEQEQTPSPPPSAAAAATKKPPSSSEEESSSDEDTDAPVAELKPASKPALKPEPVSSPKPRSKPAVSSEKRPPENNEREKLSSKRPKKDNKPPPSPGPGTGTGTGPGTEEGSRKLFQRVFSEEDETEILKGLIEFKDRKGGDPLKNVDEALGFVKKRVHVDVNKTQMVDKLRRLKRKFATAGRKKSMSDHDKKLFELSKKIWDEDDDGGEVNGGGVIVKENKNVGGGSVGGGGKSGSKNRNLKSGKGENLTATTTQNGPTGKGGGGDCIGVASVEEGKKKSKEESEGDGMDEDFRVGEGEVKEVMRTEALRRMGEKGRAEIREIWRKVEIAQMEVDVMRSEARAEEQRRIMEALGLAKR